MCKLYSVSRGAGAAPGLAVAPLLHAHSAQGAGCPIVARCPIPEQQHSSGRYRAQPFRSARPNVPIAAAVRAATADAASAGTLSTLHRAM
jgi:hypothetical protein